MTFHTDKSEPDFTVQVQVCLESTKQDKQDLETDVYLYTERGSLFCFVFCPFEIYFLNSHSETGKKYILI